MARRLSGVRRAAVLAVLALAVALLHVWLADAVLQSAAALGSGAADAAPKRIEVAFVRELQPAAPPAVAPAAAPPAPRARASRPPAPAASAPAEPPPPEPPPEPLQREPEFVPEALAQAPAASEPAPVASEAAASAPAALAEAPAIVASAATAAVPFEWPPSTRLSYTVGGHFRGPVEGQARVEWLRSGERYQVRMVLEIGPAFAPLLARTVVSDGVITPDGLEPRRFDEETKVAFREPRRLTIALEPERVRLPNGNEFARPPGVQDAASQFVHLTWLFTTQPALLQPGQAIVLPLALPRYIDRWTYDVLARETLSTPFGTIETVHVKPRRAPRPGLDLTAELWVAPSLQYLPVRILIRQDAENHVDLMIRQLPEQAAPPGAR